MHNVPKGQTHFKNFAGSRMKKLKYNLTFLSSVTDRLPKTLRRSIKPNSLVL